eukprot:CAMPEP_0176460580 /NCGR_PEP_ID=MMETSP0127-20121128/34065_1 /TAXON_ID=938130 /ORGANISM="Platyophrya macrostoma, Strain WH" /LENGTH=73 /DNA_ID=CAMNT_0017851951 /DNA_START=89 /DNA_END=310 /DNA_ORIENTATION=-
MCSGRLGNGDGPKVKDVVEAVGEVNEANKLADDDVSLCRVRVSAADEMPEFGRCHSNSNTLRGSTHVRSPNLT